MKRLIVLVCAVFCVMSLVSCGGNGEKYTIEIIIPAGSTEAFVYSDEEISPQKNKINISLGAGIGSAQVVLKPVEVREENIYEPIALKQRKSIQMEVEKDAWFKIGIGIMNPSDRDITVAVEVENVEIRIE